MIAPSDPTPQEIHQACLKILADDSKEQLAEREVKEVPYWVLPAFESALD